MSKGVGKLAVGKSALEIHIEAGEVGSEAALQVTEVTEGDAPQPLSASDASPWTV